MRYTIGTFSAVITALSIGWAYGGQPPRVPVPAGAVPMRTVELTDPFFGQRAFTLKIPAGWNFEGTVLRGPEGSGPEAVFRVTSPDGLTGVQRFPRCDWEWSDDPLRVRFLQAVHAKPLKPMPAGEFVKTFVIPNARPGAQTGSPEPIPGVSEELADKDREINRQLAAAARAAGVRGSQVTTSAERVRIQYEFKGRQEEEWLRAVTSAQAMPGYGSKSQAWVAAERAPKGQLDTFERLLTGILRSLTPDPAWDQKQQAFASQQHEAIMARMKQQSKAIAANQNAIFEASMKSAQALSEAGHRSAMASAEHTGDVQSVIDPTTGRVGQVSNRYNYSYANQSGEVVQTNSSTFDPNAQLRGAWTQLQPIKPR